MKKLVNFICPSHCDIYAVTMKFIFLLIVFLSFPVQTFAQTNDPLSPERTSYGECGTTYHEWVMLPLEAYPWGVCFF